MMHFDPPPIERGREARTQTASGPPLQRGMHRPEFAHLFHIDTSTCLNSTAQVRPPFWKLLIPVRLLMDFGFGPKLSCMFGAILRGYCGKFATKHESDFSGGQSEVLVLTAEIWRRIRRHSATKRIATGHQRSSGWRAKRSRCIKMREPCPFRRHAIEIGCLEFWMPVTGEITVTEIVGKDDDDVGSPGFSPGKCRGRQAIKYCYKRKPF